MYFVLIFCALFSTAVEAEQTLAEFLSFSQDVQNVTQLADPLPREGVRISKESEDTIKEHKKLDQQQDSLYSILKKRYFSECNEGCADSKKLKEYKREEEKQPFHFVYSASGRWESKPAEKLIITADHEDDIIRYYFSIKDAKSMSEVEGLLDKAKEELTFNDKVLLSSLFGGLFNEYYNHDRATVDNGEKVELLALLEAARDRDPIKGGVCRDIAVAQAQMLSMMGIKNSYVVSFASIENAHATVVTQDPDDPNNVVKLNYFEGDTSKANGSGTLSQDTYIPETGATFYIFDANGKPITTLPSSLGVILEQQSGSLSTPFTSEVLDGVRSVSADLISHDGHKLEVRGFAAKADGEVTVYGVMANNHFSYQHKRFSSKSTISTGAYLENLDRTDYTIDTQAFYLRTRMENRYKLIDKEGVEVTLIGNIDLQGLYGQGKQLEKESEKLVHEGMVFDGAVRFATGGEIKISKGNMETKATVVQHGFISSDDVRTYSNIAPYFDYQEVDINSKYKLDKQDLNLFADSILILDDKLGDRAGARIGVEDQQRDLQVAVGYQGAFEEDTPQWVPGATRKVTADVDKGFKFKKRKVDLHLDFQKSELQNSVHAGFTYHF